MNLNGIWHKYVTDEGIILCVNLSLVIYPKFHRYVRLQRFMLYEDETTINVLKAEVAKKFRINYLA